MKTRFDKALKDEWSDENSIDNINKAIELSKDIPIIDIIDPSSKIRHDLAEIVSRLKNADTLEMMNFSEIDNNSVN
jgi:PII-like signaling protein